MKESLKSVRGTMDYGGKEAIIRSYISRTLQEIFELYGYTPLETSLLCYYDLLALKYDEDNDILKEIYKVSDQANRDLALRYDLTVPFAKYIGSNPSIQLPYKRYEIGKVYRDGPIKKGRTREFIQCDVDCVGIEGQMIEAELISIFVEGYKKLGIDIIIKYNNRKLLNGIIETCDVSKENINKVITVIDKMEKLTKEELIAEFNKIGLEKNQINNLFKYLKMDFNQLYKLFKDSEYLKEGLTELNELNQYIEKLGLNQYVQFTPTLARGQEYYTGTIFEVYMKDGSITSSIGGGGRYDNMIGEFINNNKKYPAVGISFGLDVIFEILKDREINACNADVYIIPMGNNILSMELANKLRKNNIKVDVEMNNIKLKKALNFVNQKNIPIAIIVGDDDIKDNKIVVRDMLNGFQLRAELNNYVDVIKEILTIGKIEYKILNPGGNITALVKGCNYNANQKKLINDVIMEKYFEVEQVGFLSNDEYYLEMAGGEFCLNASRCAIYEYANDDAIELKVSGTDKKLTGKVIGSQVEIKMDINKSIDELVEVKDDFTYVKIDGILIGVLDEIRSKKYIETLKRNPDEAKKEVKKSMPKDSKDKAVGLMFIEKEKNTLTINPVVWVKDIDTVFYETACGSGSLGTAIYNYYLNKEKEIEIVQPSGYSIKIKLNIKDKIIENAIVSGIVEEE